MSDAQEPLRRALTVERYPRAEHYDPQWVVDNLMGPHPLWALEALTQVMAFRPGMRVLDLGCGSARTSVIEWIARDRNRGGALQFPWSGKACPRHDFQRSTGDKRKEMDASLEAE